MICVCKLPRCLDAVDWSAFSFGRRILILGCPGAGKSALSDELGRVLELPIFRMDDLYWLSDWRRPRLQDFHSSVEDVLSKECWILDGNYADMLEARLRRADTVVFVDRPTVVCLYRIAVRGLKRRLGDKSSLPERVRITHVSSRLDARLALKVLRFRSQVLPPMKRSLEEFARDRSVYWLRG